MRDDLSIGELARATSTGVETIRYYERIGLLPRPPRTAANYRVYGAEAARRLAFVRRARSLGFSIEAIRTLMALADQPDGPCAEVDALTRAHLAEVDAKIADLTRLRDELRTMADRCEAGVVAECRILEALAGNSADASKTG